MKTLTIIDTFGFFFRAYYALPPLKSKSGFPTGLLTGFVKFLNQIFTEHSSDYLAFALESKEKGFREEMYPDYKAHRPEAPQDLKAQLPIAAQWIEMMGFKNLSIATFEADDVIASLAVMARSAGMRVKIVSSDKDLYQLIDDGRIVLFDPVKKIEINKEGCIKKWGVKPSDFVDFQSILGDSSDNVPGVKGIGEKGAASLINEYGTLDNIYANIDKITPERTKKLLLDGRENAFLSRELVRLKTDIFDGFDFGELALADENPLFKIAEELAKYDMNGSINLLQNHAKRTILQRKGQISQSEIWGTHREAIESELGFATDTQGERGGLEDLACKFSFKATLLDTDEALFGVLQALKEGEIIALDTETDSLDTKRANIVGFSFATSQNEGYYVPIAHNYLGVGEQVNLESAKRALEMIFAHPIIGHNLKFDLALLYRIFGLPRISPLADTMILAWLANPESSVGLDNLMKYHFDHKMIYYEDVVKKGSDFSSVDIYEACGYAAEDACATFALYQKLKERLKLQNAEHLLKEADDVETPFIDTLMRMESTGVKIDTAFFEMMLSRSQNLLSNLSNEIYALAGATFNINSTQQLADILYNRLGLKASKKTKSGYSTNESVLEELKESHEIIPKLLEYREVFKLKSTYIEPLLEYAKKDENHRIYTSFLQTGTATGRLSSKNPNLQNIPVKTELGREIRHGFIAKDGYLLCSIDYSQIELRLLAHFSKDEALCGAFRHGRDIHLETATKIFGEAKAKEMRNVAKSINFGLIYGMGARKLSDQIKVSQKEAKSYIETYFESFPTVKNYLKSIEDFALTHGYSSTLLGRRRYFEFGGVAEYQKAGYLREAVNTVFQGSAADLIKLSMNKIITLLDDKPASMLLQIHDELLFEIEEENAIAISSEIASIMESIYRLNVPLKCSVNLGKRWGELK